MKVGQVVKYFFPDPVDEKEKSIVAIIAYVGESKVVLDCVDGTCMMVSSRNFDRIEIPAAENVSRLKMPA